MNLRRRHIGLSLSSSITIIALIFAFQVSGNIRIHYDSDSLTEERSVILLDVSRSMDIRDLEGNRSRLEIAKSLIQSYIEQSSGLIGLTIFAGEGINILPLNTQKTLTITTLRGLNHQSVSMQGSRLDLGVQASLTLLGGVPGGSLIILSDQDSYEGKEYLREIEALGAILKELDIHTTLVGVGSRDGGRLETGRNIWGEVEYLTYRGEIVQAPLEEDFLRDMSKRLGARYLNYRDFEVGEVLAEQSMIRTSHIRLTLLYVTISILSFMVTLALLHRVSLAKYRTYFLR